MTGELQSKAGDWDRATEPLISGSQPLEELPHRCSKPKALTKSCNCRAETPESSVYRSKWSSQGHSHEGQN